MIVLLCSFTEKKKTTTTTTGSTCFSSLLSRHFPPYFITCSNVSRAGYNRSFSNDVTGAICLYKTMDRRLCLCTNKILWEMNSFHMLKPSFIPSNLQSCWPRDWKRSIRIAQMHRHTFDFSQESTNGSACLVEWKSRNITMAQIPWCLGQSEL